MDEDDTQHLEGLMARVVLTVGAVLMAAVLMVAVLVMAGCVVVMQPVVGAPAQDKLVGMDGLPVDFITQDGDSNHAPISIQAE